MKIKAQEEQRLLEVFKANIAGFGYFAEHLPDFDYLRGSGLVTNGFGNSYGLISLTPRGYNHIIKLAENLRDRIV